MNEVTEFFDKVELEKINEQNKLLKAETSAKTDLLNYLSTAIKSSTKSDEIENLLETSILERLQDEEVIREIPTGTLLKGLLELKRLKIERETGILAVLTQKGFVINQQFNNGKQSESEKDSKVKKEEEPVSKEDFESAKKIYDLLQNIKDAEIEEQ